MATLSLTQDSYHCVNQAFQEATAVKSVGFQSRNLVNPYFYVESSEHFASAVAKSTTLKFKGESLTCSFSSAQSNNRVSGPLTVPLFATQYKGSHTSSLSEEIMSARIYFLSNTN